MLCNEGKREMRTLGRGESEGGFVLLRTLLALTVMLICAGAILSSFAMIMKRTAGIREKAERIIVEHNLQAEDALR
nr:type II secretion system protein [Treponema socranskii]